jgi:hypothetical protein
VHARVAIIKAVQHYRVLALRLQTAAAEQPLPTPVDQVTALENILFDWLRCMHAPLQAPHKVFRQIMLMICSSLSCRSRMIFHLRQTQSAFAQVQFRTPIASQTNVGFVTSGGSGARCTAHLTTRFAPTAIGVCPGKAVSNAALREARRRLNSPVPQAVPSRAVLRRRSKSTRYLVFCPRLPTIIRSAGPPALPTIS